MEEKYGTCSGKLQEQEGPIYARRMLKKVEINKDDIERICYLVGHHHTYNDIDNIDYQILIEADFLVNFYEDELEQDTIQTVLQKIFQTKAGKALCRLCYFKE